MHSSTTLLHKKVKKTYLRMRGRPPEEGTTTGARGGRSGQGTTTGAAGGGRRRGRPVGPAGGRPG